MSDKIKTQLDDLLRKSRSLESGDKKKNKYQIGLTQITRFFDSISESTKDSFGGKLLLAQTGVDISRIQILMSQLPPKIDLNKTPSKPTSSEQPIQKKN